MRYNIKIIILSILILVTFLSVFFTSLTRNFADFRPNFSGILSYSKRRNVSDYDVWCIFTKANERRNQIKKYEHMLLSMLGYSSVQLTLHLIVDEASKPFADEANFKSVNFTKKSIQVKYYDIEEVTSKINDIVSVMKPHFSPKAGSYYSDSLFYISLGLYRIAPSEMSRAVLIDVDLQFEDDIALLFNEFNSFTGMNLFGLGPELAPVYFHLLSSFRARNGHRHLNIGMPCCARLSESSLNDPRMYNVSETGRNRAFTLDPEPAVVPGRPGLNSGVVLLHLDRIRSSLLFQMVTSGDFVDSLAKKYLFKGHLGDQDFYSLLSWELPSIVHTVDCGWNRQLCTWWRDHGYKHVHRAFSYCPNKTKIYHANCNSPFPN